LNFTTSSSLNPEVEMTAAVIPLPIHFHHGIDSCPVGGAQRGPRGWIGLAGSSVL